MLLDAVESSARGDLDVIKSVVGAADNMGNTAAHHIVTIDVETARLQDSDECAVLLTRLAKYDPLNTTAFNDAFASTGAC